MIGIVNGRPLPKTVDEAAEILLHDIFTQHIVALANIADSEFARLCEKIMSDIIYDFKISNHGNVDLIDSCAEIDGLMHPALVIMRAVRDKAAKIAKDVYKR